MNDLNQLCYKKSIQVLKNNSTKFGILASGKSQKAVNRNYLSIFGRDASICSLGMALSQDKQLIKTARNSLITLAKHQATNGQIPFYVKPEKNEIDFYYLGCIDSTLWWLIAIKHFDKNTNSDLAKKLKIKINKAINWLLAQEHPNFYLLSQNEASDWADLMPRSGFVLYTNALWYWVKKLYKLNNTKLTKKYFNYIFNNNSHPSKNIIQNNKKLGKLLSHIKYNKKDKTYLSFINYYQWGKEVDVFGNILACLTGLASPSKIKKIIKYLQKNKIDKPYGPKTVLNPITKNDSAWRPYMKHHNLNKPWQYHNGGIWPFIDGWWAVLLSMIDKNLATKELTKMAELNKINNWQFNEWFHGQTEQPMGMPYQSWNAAMYLFIYNHLNK